MRTEAQVRRDAMDAAIWWLAEDYRFLRAMRAHVEELSGRCSEQCGVWPCLTLELAIAARRIHEGRIRSTERLCESPTVPLRAVPLSAPDSSAGRHRFTKEAVR